MSNAFERTELMFGKEGMGLLASSHIAVFGVGGVGGYVCEALARTGIGEISIFDKDIISISNLNRQIIATVNTIGQEKVKAMKDRLLSINPNIIVNTFPIFVSKENIDDIDFNKFNYVVDAIDTVSSKLLIIEHAKKSNTLIISSMGAGNKINPNMFSIADIEKTSVCPLAKVMRYELRKRGIKKVKVAYSKEEPFNSLVFDSITHKQIPASNSFVPSSVGLLIASEVVKDLLGL